jgi:hypothetical protein
MRRISTWKVAASCAGLVLVACSRNDHEVSSSAATAPLGINGSDLENPFAIEVGTIQWLTGKIKAYEGYAYLVVNWDCRCMTSYKIEGDTAEFHALDGRVITAKSLILERRAWSGKIRILEFSAQE